VVWNHTSQRLERLSLKQALQLLEKLRSTEAWRTQGVPFTRTITQYRLATPPRKSRKHAESRVDENPENRPAPEVQETHEEERMRLPPEAGAKLFDFLQGHESQLKAMAEEDEKQAQQVMYEVWTALVRAQHTRELRDIGLTLRPLPWVRDPSQPKAVCDLPPDRATVALGDSSWFWRGCIEQPNRFAVHSQPFLKLTDALTWAEDEMVKLQAEAQQAAQQPAKPLRPQLSALEWAVKLKADLGEYWIDPARLEPERLTYNVIIDLNYAPFDFKTMELSFGKKMRYDERFVSPEKLARELNLSLTHVKAKSFGTRANGWCQFTSRVTYFQDQLAAAQAQQLWDSSAILAKHQEGTVLRALYGYQEVETGFCTWLGGCDDKDNPWPKSDTRAEHMADWAIRESLAYALDVPRYKEYTGIPCGALTAKVFTDDKILEMLHMSRSDSDHIPQAARAESQRWLQMHNVNPSIRSTG
jgi:hypothetical protein